MGIFAEDLINFGNLLEAEIELKLTPADLKKAFAEFEFHLQDGMLKIVKEKKGIIFKKKLEVRLREDPKNVYNRKEDQLRCIKAFPLTSIPEDFGNILIKDSEFVCMNLWEAIKSSPIYERIPKQFRDRVVISRYFFKEGYILLYLKVEK